jgi:hypothetical protein
MALEGLLLTVYRKVTDDKVRMDAGKRGTMCSNMKKKEKKKKKFKFDKVRMDAGKRGTVCSNIGTGVVM